MVDLILELGSILCRSQLHIRFVESKMVRIKKLSFDFESLVESESEREKERECACVCFTNFIFMVFCVSQCSGFVGQRVNACDLGKEPTIKRKNDTVPKNDTKFVKRKIENL